MGEYNNIMRVRVLNQCTQTVRVVASTVNGTTTSDMAFQKISAGKFKYISIPGTIDLKTVTINLSTYNSVTSTWEVFGTTTANDIVENLLWITETNGVIMLTPFGCTDSSNIGQLYSLQLYNNSQFAVRMYVSYTFDGKSYSKKMPVTSLLTKKAWIPAEATSITIKLQWWFLYWIDMRTYKKASLTQNYCYEAYPDGIKPDGKEVTCS